MYCLAFYHGRRRILDRTIQAFTGSRFSHVELVHPSGLCVSSSGLDGGVRLRLIHLDPEKWHLMPVGVWARPDAWQRALPHLGAPYDFRGILMSQLFGAGRHEKHSWFCSELVAHCLGLTDPHRLSPGGLYAVVQDLNRASGTHPNAPSPQHEKDDGLALAPAHIHR